MKIYEGGHEIEVNCPVCGDPVTTRLDVSAVLTVNDYTEPRATVKAKVATKPVAHKCSEPALPL